jgi:hypothetical protein
VVDAGQATATTGPFWLGPDLGSLFAGALIADASAMTQLSYDTLSPTPVNVLVLGAGWTSTFLLPLCSQRGISTAATARSPPPDSDLIPFVFDPISEDDAPFRRLPNAQTVLITFPLRGDGASTRLVEFYQATRQSYNSNETMFIQLGSTSVWPVRLLLTLLFINLI